MCLSSARALRLSLHARPHMRWYTRESQSVTIASVTGQAEHRECANNPVNAELRTRFQTLIASVSTIVTITGTLLLSLSRAALLPRKPPRCLTSRAEHAEQHIAELESTFAASRAELQAALVASRADSRRFVDEVCYAACHVSSQHGWQSALLFT